MGERRSGFYDLLGWYSSSTFCFLCVTLYVRGVSLRMSGWVTDKASMRRFLQVVVVVVGLVVADMA